MVKATLDEVLDALKLLVKTAEVGNLIAAATNKVASASFAGVAPAPPAAPGGVAAPSTPTPATGGHHQRHAPKPPKKPQKPVGFLKGLGRGIKNKISGGRLGQAYKGAQAKTGRMLGGKGVSGMKGLGGLGGGLAKAAGPVGVAIAAADALNEFKKAVYAATDAQLASAKKLAEVNGSLAATFAVREVSELKRDMQMAEATAGGVSELAASEQKRKDATLPIDALMENATNKVLGILNDIIAEIADAVTEVIKGIEKIPGVGKLRPDEPAEDVGLAVVVKNAATEMEWRDRQARDLLAAAEAEARRIGGGGTSRPPG